MKITPMPMSTDLEDLDIAEVKDFIQQVKVECQNAIDNDPDYDGEAELLLAAIDNLQDELINVKELENLDSRKQARILAFMTFLMGMIPGSLDEDDEDDDFEFEDLFDDFEDNEEEDEEEKELIKR